MLSIHELWEVQDLLLGCQLSVRTLANYVRMTKDEELKGILQAHLDHHIKHYNTFLVFLKGEKAEAEVPTIETKIINSPMMTSPFSTGMDDIDPNDRDVANWYLLDMKRAAKDFAAAAVETASAGMRNFLEDSFKMCSHHAYEIWAWMANAGFYPVQAASKEDMNRIARTYTPITVDEGK